MVKYFRTKNFAHALRKRLPRIPTVTQHALHATEFSLATPKRLQGTRAIRHFGSRHCHRMRQPLAVHCNMALDSTDFFACIIAFQACRVSILDTLRVHDQERAAGVAPQFLSGRANLIFLKLAQAGSLPRLAHSKSSSTSEPYATWENHWAKLATGSPSAVGIALRRKPRTNPSRAGPSSYAHSPEAAG